MKNRFLLAALTALVIALPARAAIKIPNFFSDNMVVQQKSTLVIPGKAAPDATITATASWSKKAVTAKAAADGSFKVELTTPKAGGPYTITLTDGKSTVTLSNVLSGEVWVCSGQSNMEMPVNGWGKVLNYEQELANANYPDIRLLQIMKRTAFSPVSEPDLNLRWSECTTETVDNFSAAAYFFAREIHKTLGVPVAVIDCTWGGSLCEAWTPAQTLSTIQSFNYMNDFLTDGEFDGARFENFLNHRLDEYRNVPADMNPAEIQKNWNKIDRPRPFSEIGLDTFDGVMWYQCSFSLPAELAGKPMHLSLGVIDTQDDTYLNGVKVGQMNNYTKERHYSVDAGISKTDNVLSIKVVDNSGEGGFLSPAEDFFVEIDGKKVSIADNWSFAVDLDFHAAQQDGISINAKDTPSSLYNGMLHPLHILPIRGFLWYQGCSNVGRDEEYAEMFPKMIEEWRRIWGNADLPFYFVQLAAYLQPVEVQPDSKWAALRDAQTAALKLKNTGMAVATDIGDANDIHPKNKQEVGRRLALNALKGTYGKKVIAAAPTPVKAKAEDGHVHITFSGAVCQDNTKGFVVKTSDGKYHAVKATADKKSVVLHTHDMGTVTEVLYNRADCPQGLLRCAKSNLPVAPFVISL